jgi:hypothetical protein
MRYIYIYIYYARCYLNVYSTMLKYGVGSKFGGHLWIGLEGPDLQETIHFPMGMWGCRFQVSRINQSIEYYNWLVVWKIFFPIIIWE